MKTILIALLSLVAISAQAATLASTNENEFLLNRGTESMRKAQLGSALTKRTERMAKCVYDFSVVGGAISAINLRDGVDSGQPCKLPKDSIIRDVLIDVRTAPTSGGAATIALGAAAANDLKAATAIASYTGLVAGVPVGSAATAIRLAADTTITATIATAALTAGKLNVLIKYQLSE